MPLRPSLLLGAVLLAGCGSLGPVSRPPAEPPVLRLSPASFGAVVELAQRLQVQRGESTRTLDAALAIDAERVQLAMLAGGRRVLTLHFDGRHLEQKRDPRVPGVINGARILSDLQLVYWPAAAVRAALPRGWSLAEGENWRTLAAQGEPMVEIHYRGQPRWRGRTQLLSHRYDYVLTIDSEELE